MSVRAITWAYTQELSCGAKFVLVTLADYADENRSCWPSVAKLSAKTGQADRTIRYHLEALEKSGHITRVRERRPDGTYAQYRFILQLDWPAADFARPAAIPADGKKQQEPAAKNDENQRQNLPRNNRHLEPSIYPSMRAREITHNTNEEPEGFSKWFDAYPKKTGRHAAEREYAAAIEHVEPDVLLRTAIRYAGEREGQEEKFTKAPANWLRDGCWADERQSNGNGFVSSISSDEKRRQAIELEKWIAAGAKGNPPGDSTEILQRERPPHG